LESAQWKGKTCWQPAAERGERNEVGRYNGSGSFGVTKPIANSKKLPQNHCRSRLAEVANVVLTAPPAKGVG
jgi:hypothetical protein